MKRSCNRCGGRSRIVMMVTYVYPGGRPMDLGDPLGGPYCAACEERLWVGAVMPALNGTGPEAAAHLRATRPEGTCRRCLKPVPPDTMGAVMRSPVEFTGEEEVVTSGDAKLTLLCPTCVPAIQAAIDRDDALARSRN
jgi:hypothetical protein